MQCPFCNNTTKDSASFCSRCGKRIPRCPTCGIVIRKPLKYCVNDGTPIPEEILSQFPRDAAVSLHETEHPSVGLQMRKYCINCGRPCAPGSKYCLDCMSSSKKEATAFCVECGALCEEGEMLCKDCQARGKKRTSPQKGLLWFFVILLLIGALGGTCYYLYQSNQLPSTISSLIQEYFPGNGGRDDALISTMTDEMYDGEQLSENEADLSSEETVVTVEVTPSPEPTPSQVATPDPTPEPTPLPSEGTSINGNRLTDIVYDASGNIIKLTEHDNGTLKEWMYVYDSTGAFTYRMRNIGSVPCHLTSKVMPGTDVTYSELESAVQNCVGFTIQYEVTSVRKGDGLGDRYLYIYNGTTWEMIGTFSYDTYGKTAAEIYIDNPITIERFTTPRIHADDSSFMIEQQLIDIWVADYSYVQPT